MGWCGCRAINTNGEPVQRLRTIIVQLCPATITSDQPPKLRASSTAEIASLKVRPPYMSPTTEPFGNARAVSMVGTVVINGGISNAVFALATVYLLGWRCFSNSSNNEQHEKNDHQQTHSAARIVAPPGAVRPRGQ